MTATLLIHGDARQLPLRDASVDAIVTDPPYGLSFMGKAWDHGVPGVPFWLEALRVLKPGGHLLAFGGTRTFHRQAVAIEDAGFEVRDCLSWLYGSGFPKSLDVSKAIDKAAGAEREVVTLRQRPATGRMMQGDGGYAFGEAFAVTAPATDEAAEWDGWGTALKPSYEPILWACKPLSVVSFSDEVNHNHHALGALICLLSSASGAAPPSTSSPAGSPVACASVLASACLANQSDGSGPTGTFKSPAAASTASNIASSWSAILDALSTGGSRSTTSTASSLTTGLRTLSWSLSPITSGTTMPPCGCLRDGRRSPAGGAASTSSAEWANWIDTLKRSALASAIEPIGQGVAGLLASIVAETFGGPVAASSAPRAATTRAGASELSPAWEPIVMARKPLVGTVAGNVLAHGTGALNIAGTRIETDERIANHRGTNGAAGRTYGNRDEYVPGSANADNTHAAGRWPANVALDETAATLLDQQTGTLTSGSGVRRPHEWATVNTYGMSGAASDYERAGDSGGASRFFYVAKPSKAERNAGLAHVEPRFAPTMGNGIGGKEHDPETATPKANHHPTVKPVALMRWLVRLVCPPGGVVLDPFMGSGTTLEAATLEGFHGIGVELTAEYLPLAKGRTSRPLQPGLFS